MNDKQFIERKPFSLVSSSGLSLSVCIAVVVEDWPRY